MGLHENQQKVPFLGHHASARRFMVILSLCIILAISLSACTFRFGINESNRATSAPLKVPPQCDKLWNLNIGQEGFNKTSASFMTLWTSENVTLTLSVQPKAYHAISIENSKKMVEGATTYYLRKDELAWDAEGWKSGTIYSQTISMEYDSIFHD